MPSARVFLSYAAVDRPRVMPIVEALEADGIDVWWDPDIPRGQHFNRAIEQALERAVCALVVWSTASVRSEWVFNEASEARKRQILVPVLIDDVDPPLEFRHLQAARLVGWTRDLNDPEWTGLLQAIRALLQQPDDGTARVPARPPAPPSADRTWWRSPAGVAAGAGLLLAGLSLFLFTLGQLGFVGGGSGPDPAASGQTQAPAAPGAPPAPATAGASEPLVEPASASVPTPPAATDTNRDAAARVNLLASDQGGTLVIANEQAWQYVLRSENPMTTAVSANAFAVFGFRDGRLARVDGVGVFVEYSNDSYVKTLAISASNDSETGPFTRVALLQVPNYRNMRGPVHDFPVTPFTARFVKVEPLETQSGARGSLYVGNIRLYGTLR